MRKVILGMVLLGLGFGVSAKETVYECHISTMAKMDLRTNKEVRMDPIKENNTIVINDEGYVVKTGGMFSKDKYFWNDKEDSAIAYGDKMMIVNRLDSNSIVIYMGNDNFHNTHKDYIDVIKGYIGFSECSKQQ